MRSLVFLLLVFSSTSFSKTKILNADGSVAQTAEQTVKNSEAAGAANNPAGNIFKRLKNSETAKRATQNPGGSVTRMVQGCQELTVKEGTLRICKMTVGGAAGDSPIYVLNGIEFDGRVKKNPDGSFTLISTEALSDQPLRRPVYSGETLPSEFSCGSNNKNELQCLVCSCFFEARGSSYPEQVRVARTKHSRVLNPKYPGSVCENVYYKHSGGGAAYSWTTAGKIYETASGKNIRPRDVKLGESSTDLASADVSSFRTCAQSSSESLHYRNEYFASYYWTKNLESSGGWIAACKENTDHLSGNLISSVTDSNGKRIEFDHNFRRVCESGELDLTHATSSPLVSPRPQARPRGAKVLE